MGHLQGPQQRPVPPAAGAPWLQGEYASIYWGGQAAARDSRTLVTWPMSKVAWWGLARVPSGLCLVPILFPKMRILLLTVMVTRQ